MADKEMEMVLNEEISRCRKLIHDKKDLVEKLANALVEKESLDIIQIKKILGVKPFPEDEVIKMTINEVEFQ